MIECIEVICGFVLILYGFDVIGGVVNIIIKKVLNEWIGVVILEGILFFNSFDFGN